MLNRTFYKEKEKKQCKNTVKSNQFYTQDKTDKHKLMYWYE